MAALQPPNPPLYPSFSPDMKKIAFAAIMSPAGDTDRGVFVVNADGTGLAALFDAPGSYDSAPAWSPDGKRIAFESNADVGGANPEHDIEVWTMAADGSDSRQLTSNALHDEGPSWSPDGGRMLVYMSGPDDDQVMTSTGRHLRRLTTFVGLDESPDWQAIPAPRMARRCGDAVARGPGARDVRASGHGLTCARVLALARRARRVRRPRAPGAEAARAGCGGRARRVRRPRAPGAEAARAGCGGRAPGAEAARAGGRRPAAAVLAVQATLGADLLVALAQLRLLLVGLPEARA